MTQHFKDHFSTQADLYVKYRPHYPADLFKFLASLCTEHEMVWDCGTGNGQAALGLANYFKQVIATEPSEAQLRNKMAHEKITYRIEKAETSSLPSGSADLITIANALHWFEFDAFYKEVDRVLKPEGIVAAWAYGTPSINPQIDAVIRKLDRGIIDPYWRAENRLVQNRYIDLPFPFQEIKSPQYIVKKQLEFDSIIGYLNTWSAVQRFIAENNSNPVDLIKDELKRVWGNTSSEKEVTWDLLLKVGKLSSH